MDDLATTAYRDTRAEAVRFTSILDHLGDAFRARAIPAVALKGAAFLVANLVPALGARSMSDIDVLVSAELAGDAADALERGGFTALPDTGPLAPAEFRPYHRTFGSPDGRLVEMHLRLGPSRWGYAADATG